MRATPAFVGLVALALLAGCGGGPEDARPAASTTPTAAAAPEAADHPARMDDAAFWQLIADTRAAAGNDTDGQSDLLEQRLRRLPADQIAQFERVRGAQLSQFDLPGESLRIGLGQRNDGALATPPHRIEARPQVDTPHVLQPEPSLPLLRRHGLPAPRRQADNSLAVETGQRVVDIFRPRVLVPAEHPGPVERDKNLRTA